MTAIAPCAGSLLLAVLLAASSASAQTGTQVAATSYVVFGDPVTAPVNHDAIVGWTLSPDGERALRLEGSNFYLAIERGDLADQYNSARMFKTAVLLGGVGIFAVGAVMVLNTVLEGQKLALACEFDEPDCAPADYGLLAVGVGLSFGGLILWVLAASISVDPAEPAEARRMVRKHNERVRARSQLSAAQAGWRRLDARPMRIAWGFYASDRAASALLRMEL